MRRLQRDVADLRARIDAMAIPPVGPTQRHSKDALVWAKRYGLDLDDFEPFEPAALGTYTMSVAEAARMLNLSIEQVRRLLRTGRLRGTALGGRAGWRVSRADVVRLARERAALVAGRK